MRFVLIFNVPGSLSYLGREADSLPYGGVVKRICHHRKNVTGRVGEAAGFVTSYSASLKKEIVL